MENDLSSSGVAGGSASRSRASLSSAVTNGEEDLLRSLLTEKNCPDEVWTVSGIALLRLAIQKGYLNITRILLENGARADDRDVNSKTNLELAVESGLHDIAELLLEFHAYFDLAIEQGSPSLLHRAIERDDLETTILLLRWGANINRRNKSSYTPLMVAVERRNILIVKLLLEHGADLTAKSNSGVSAAYLSHGSAELTRILDDARFLKGPHIDNTTEEEAPAPSVTKGLPRAPIHDPEKMAACHGFQANIIDFFIGESERRIEASPSIYEILYGEGPTSIMEKMRPPDATGKSPSFRWYHLPANNVSTCPLSDIHIIVTN